MQKKNEKYEMVEEEMLKKEFTSRRKKKKMKVSGKSIFKLQGIIKRKSQISKSK